MKRAALLSIVLGLTPLAFAQQDAATTAPAETKAAKPAKPLIYNEKAEAKDQIAAALKKAKKENRRVLIQWGANWCGWCHLLHEKFASDKKLARELMYEYDVVLIDIGKWDKNMDLATSYGADLKGTGVPYLTVLDASGKPLANQETGVLESKAAEGQPKAEPGHDSAKVMAFLKKYEAAPLTAESVLGDARAAAKAKDKKVFLHFGAPWCGYCHKLDAWLDREDVAKAFGKDYVEVKIDQDRMTGAKEIFARYNKAGQSGIPWFVIIDPATGESVVTSDAKEGNVGFPTEDHEIAHFVGMLKATRKNLSDSDIAALKTTLEEGRKK